MENLITLFMTTIPERHSILPRAWEYYSELRCDKILVDSSENKCKTLSKHEDLNYILVPGADIYEKMEVGLKEINTPYLLFIADDDFAIKKSIKYICSYIQCHKEFIALNGQWVKFDEDSFRLIENYAEWQYKKLIESKCGHSENVFDRLECMFRNFTAPSRAIVSTKIFTDTLKLILENEILRPTCYFDKILGYMIALEGKFTTLPLLLQFRSNGARCIVSSNKGMPGSDAKFESIISKLSDIDDPLSRILSKKYNLNEKKAQSYTQEILDNYSNIWKFNEDKLNDSLTSKKGWIKNNFYKVLGKNRSLPSSSRAYREDIKNIFKLVKRYPQ